MDRWPTDIVRGQCHHEVVRFDALVVYDVTGDVARVHHYGFVLPQEGLHTGGETASTTPRVAPEEELSHVGVALESMLHAVDAYLGEDGGDDDR